MKDNSQSVQGIYKITNLINGKGYVGKSRNILLRWREHRSIVRRLQIKGIAKEVHAIHRAILKYGLDNFKFEILYAFTLSNKDITDSMLSTLEIFFIADQNTYTKYGYGYNLTKGGDGGSFETHDENFLRRFSKPILCIETGEYYRSCGYAGKHYNELPASIYQAARLGTFSGGYHWKFITWEKFDKLKNQYPLFDKPIEYLGARYINSASLGKDRKDKYKNRIFPVKCIETGEVFLSTGEANKAKGIKNSSLIPNAIKRNRRVFGYHWEYISLEEYKRGNQNPKNVISPNNRLLRVPKKTGQGVKVILNNKIFYYCSLRELSQKLLGISHVSNFLIKKINKKPNSPNYCGKAYQLLKDATIEYCPLNELVENHLDLQRA